MMSRRYRLGCRWQMSLFGLLVACKGTEGAAVTPDASIDEPDPYSAASRCSSETFCDYTKAKRVFLGAEGFGVDTPAGRGTTGTPHVVTVTNLDARGEGSLHDGLADCARESRAMPGRGCFVTFQVAGTIDLAVLKTNPDVACTVTSLKQKKEDCLPSDLEVTEPYVTIAGQTAPPPGIVLKNGGLSIRTHDVLVQHVTTRRGDEVCPATESGACGRGDASLGLKRNYGAGSTGKTNCRPEHPGDCDADAGLACVFGRCAAKAADTTYTAPVTDPSTGMKGYYRSCTTSASCGEAGGYSCHDVTVDAGGIYPAVKTCPSGSTCACFENAVYNVVLDHVSVGWGVDETLVFASYSQSPYAQSPAPFGAWGMYDITVSQSIVAEGLRYSGHLLGQAVDLGHGLLIGDQSARIAVHHNIFSQNRIRNPAVYPGSTTVIQNNVVYAFKDDHGGTLLDLGALTTTAQKKVVWSGDHTDTSQTSTIRGNWYRGKANGADASAPVHYRGTCYRDSGAEPCLTAYAEGNYYINGYKDGGVTIEHDDGTSTSYGPGSQLVTPKETLSRADKPWPSKDQAVVATAGTATKVTSPPVAYKPDTALPSACASPETCVNLASTKLSSLATTAGSFPATRTEVDKRVVAGVGGTLGIERHLAGVHAGPAYAYVYFLYDPNNTRVSNPYDPSTTRPEAKFSPTGVTWTPILGFQLDSNDGSSVYTGSGPAQCAVIQCRKDTGQAEGVCWFGKDAALVATTSRCARATDCADIAMAITEAAPKDAGRGSRVQCSEGYCKFYDFYDKEWQSTKLACTPDKDTTTASSIDCDRALVVPDITRDSESDDYGLTCRHKLGAIDIGTQYPEWGWPTTKVRSSANGTQAAKAYSQAPAESGCSPPVTTKRWTKLTTGRYAGYTTFEAWLMAQAVYAEIGRADCDLTH